MTNPPPSRRDFLTGQAIRKQIEQTGERLADELTAADAPPSAGDTIRLATRAMACEFAVIMNPGPAEQVNPASAALDLIHELEAQLTVYRDDSEMSRINQQAAQQSIAVEPQLFDLLLQARQLTLDTGGCFDPTSGPLIDLWRTCRQVVRLPTDNEIAQQKQLTGIDQIEFDEPNHQLSYKQPGVEINLGGIGKGYALDRAGQMLLDNHLDNWLFHGGNSSLLARGHHNALDGWPVGIRNPLFPKQRLATVLLRDCALSTSGTGVQHVRIAGRRFGHILDPRTGWPADDMLSVTVLAPTAAAADALSTAFFVMGVENAREYCDNQDGIGAILVPPPERGSTLEPIICGIPEETLFFSDL